MTQGHTGSRGGVGFIGLLTLLFIGLKLSDHIAWSWWWVFSPIWGALALIALAVIAVTLVGLRARAR